MKAVAAEPALRHLHVPPADHDDPRERLAESVYDDLRAIARSHMRFEQRAVTLQATALVHEAFLRLFHGKQAEYADRIHFVATAALQMRRVLVDYARRRKTGVRVVRELSYGSSASRIPAPELALLLDRLGEIDTRAAQIVDLAYWGGLTHPEIAQRLGISITSVRRDLDFSRRWLAAEYNATT